MSSYSPALVFGFHVCDRPVRDKLLLAQAEFRLSQNAYDWLGEGVYFFESDPKRASMFGEAVLRDSRLSKGVITDPVLIGAIIELSYCLDLTTVAGRSLLVTAECTLDQSAKHNAGAGRFGTVQQSMHCTNFSRSLVRSHSQRCVLPFRKAAQCMILQCFTLRIIFRSLSAICPVSRVFFYHE